MSAVISAAKQAALLALLQNNPDIGTDDATYTEQLISRAVEWIVPKLKLTRYPELAQGYSRSGASPSTNISALSSNEFEISVNDSLRVIVALTLSGLTSGAAIATEMQTQIRADASDGFDEVVVDFTDSLYTVTSGRFGPDSSIVLGFTETNKHVLQALKLSPPFGGIEVPGIVNVPQVDHLVLGLAEHYYRMVGIEGAKSASVPGGVNVSGIEIPKWIKDGLNDKRRLWT